LLLLLVFVADFALLLLLLLLLLCSTRVGDNCLHLSAHYLLSLSNWNSSTNWLVSRRGARSEGSTLLPWASRSMLWRAAELQIRPAGDLESWKNGELLGDFWRF